MACKFNTSQPYEMLAGKASVILSDTLNYRDDHPVLCLSSAGFHSGSCLPGRACCIREYPEMETMMMKGRSEAGNWVKELGLFSLKKGRLRYMIVVFMHWWTVTWKRG